MPQQSGYPRERGRLSSVYAPPFLGLLEKIKSFSNSTAAKHYGSSSVNSTGDVLVNALSLSEKEKVTQQDYGVKSVTEEIKTFLGIK